ncbi:MAG TPA: hypothetical protein VN812_17445, partial [Candidatus Acidoferrales bacterium]|nr:hypothetical protein [Candidatus Acidoferrales bacterium]
MGPGAATPFARHTASLGSAVLDELGKLRFARFRFRLRAQTALYLPPYKGSTLRGGFGLAFKDAVCVVSHRDCDRCLLRSKCAYPYIFETPVPEDSRRMASVEHAPHPFVIQPPLDDHTQYAIGDQLEFGLVLIGRAIDYLPYFIFAFEHLGSGRGIGRAIEPHAEGGKLRARSERGKFAVEGVFALNGQGEGTPVYDGRARALSGTIHAETIVSRFPRPLGEGQGEGTPRLSLHFLTPTRLI